ncbi:MAG: DUF4235 domain-containing protein [Solirubrobacteraceae bacterium]|jgi:hypothetical protein
MNLLYKPFAIVAGIVGSLLGKRAFKAIWARIDDSPSPPPPRTGEAGLIEVASGAALQAATVAAIAATVDRLMARAFHHLFGVWPEKSRADGDDQLG